MFLSIIFAIITSSSLGCMEKQDPLNITIKTVDQKEMIIPRETAQKIPLIDNLINDSNTKTVEFIPFPKESYVTKKVLNDIFNYSNNIPMPKTFIESMHLYKALAYLLFSREIALKPLRHACFECPLAETDLEYAGTISVPSNHIQYIFPRYNYTSAKSLICKGHDGLISSVTFSPNGLIFASGGTDNIIRIWDTITGECINTLNEHTRSINHICFSHNGLIFASGSTDKTIKIWDAKTAKCINTFNRHTRAINCVVFSPNEKILVSASNDHTIKLWNPSTGDCIKTIDVGTKHIGNINFSPDGLTFASCGDNNIIRLWDTKTGSCMGTLEGHIESVNNVAFSPDGLTIASASMDETIKIWDTKTRECIRTLYDHTKCVNSVIFSPNGLTLASTSDDSTVKLWNTKTKKCTNTLSGNFKYIRDVVFNPEGLTIVSASYTTIQIHHFKREDKPFTLVALLQERMLKNNNNESK